MPVICWNIPDFIWSTDMIMLWLIIFSVPEMRKNSSTFAVLLASSARTPDTAIKRNRIKNKVRIGKASANRLARVAYAVIVHILRLGAIVAVGIASRLVHTGW